MKHYKFILNNYINEKSLSIKGSSCNVSLINDKIYLSRCTNYSFLEPTFKKKYKLGRHLWFNDTIWTDEKIYDENFNFIKNITTSTEHYKQASGAEDFRIIKWNNENYGIYSNVVIPFKKNEVHFCKIDENLQIKNDKKIITKEATEKNWQPIESMPFKCVYSYKPFKIIDLNNSKFIEVENNKLDTNYRGSTQIIKYKDYNLGIVHERKENNKEHCYIHYFVLFDQNMNILKISNPFSFFGVDIEFCTFLSYTNEIIKVIVSINDQLTFEFDINENLLLDIFEHKLFNNKFDENIYEKMYDIAKINENYYTAICLATFTKNSNILAESITLNYNSKLRKDKKILLQKILMELYNKYR